MVISFESKDTTMPSYDLLYLKQTISEPLSEGLAQLAIVQPDDPVEYLGTYLIQYVGNEKRKIDIQINENQRNDIINKQKEIERSKDKEIRDSKLSLEEEKEANEGYKYTLLHTKSIDNLYSLFFDRLLVQTGAISSYIGRKYIDSKGKSYIVWEYSTSKSNFIIDKFVSEEKGITFDLFKDSQLDSEQIDTPKYIYVENVIREPKILYYGIPKIGSYCTTYLKYNTYFTDDIFDKEIDITSNTSPNVESILVLAMDTLSDEHGRKFTKDEINIYLEWSQILKQSIENYEKEIYIKELEENKKEITKLKTLIPEIQSKTVEYNLKAKSIVENITEIERRSIKEAELYIDYLKELIEFYSERLQYLSQCQIPPKKSILNVFYIFLSFIGCRMNLLCNSATSTPIWSKISKLISKDNLTGLLKEFVLETVANNISTSTLRIIKENLDTILEDEIDNNNPVVGLCLKFTKTGVIATESIISTRNIAELEAANNHI